MNNILDARIAQRRMVHESAFEIVGNMIQIRWQQFGGEIPRCLLGAPRATIRLIGANQHARALLAHIKLTIEIDAVNDFLASRLVELNDFRHFLGDQILMRHAQHGQFKAHKAAHFTRPQATGVHHMLGMDIALIGEHIPAAIGPLLHVRHHAFLHNLCPTHARGLGISMRGAGRIEMAFQRMPHGTDEMLRIEQREMCLGFFHRDELGIHPQIAVARMRHFQPVPTILVGNQHDAAGQMNAGGLAGNFLNLLVEIDGIFLQLRHIGITVQRMEPARRMPGGARGEHIALQQHHIFPPPLGEVIEHAGTDNTAADDHNPGRTSHGLNP